MLEYLSLDIICSSKLTVFLELRSRKTVRFSEQIMSADKYPNIFSHQMEAIVFIRMSYLSFIGIHTSLYHERGLYNYFIPGNTINATHARRMMGRLNATPSNVQRFFCILIGCIFFGMLYLSTKLRCVTYTVLVNEHTLTHVVTFNSLLETPKTLQFFFLSREQVTRNILVYFQNYAVACLAKR